ncbi:hypothetical protein Athai_60720 [Actinocatenispora thailandica]|uniref:AB hydrolase-1 domain-containing protein n=1 Tax=Actinocatenispora thailandica TaxID=227318 RepID=A0A7R7I0I6_9ACTN|nr:alpha/beta hydrolase [Actinocatenispora thailandica]BCJ38569.1 hypothetical protein Athai_60720 [Actinocatenispora thailandica]
MPLTASNSLPDPPAAAFDALVGGGVARRELDRGGRFLRWLEAGSAAPAVVFETGIGSPSTTWAVVFAALAPDHRVLAYDRAGYGASDPAAVSLDGQLADLIAVAESAGPEPCVLVGHSWGGLLVQLAAWRRPDLVAGLVLVDPSHESLWLRPPEPAAVREWARYSDPAAPPRADPRSADVSSSAEELDREVARGASDDPAVRALLLDAGRWYLATDEQLRMHLDEFPMVLHHLDELADRRRTAVWPKVPVVTLTATKGRPPLYVPPVLAAQEQLAAVAGGRHVVVPDSGHHIHVDRPDLVIRSIRDVC